MKKHLSSGLAFVALAAVSSHAFANSARNIEVTHALTVPATGSGITTLTPVVEYDHELLSQEFGRSGNLVVTVEYVFSDGVQLLTSQASAQLSPGDVLAWLPPADLVVTGTFGRVVGKVTVSMGADSVEVARVPVYFMRDGADVELVSLADYTHARRLALPPVLAPPGADVGEPAPPAAARHSRPFDCAVDICN